MRMWYHMQAVPREGVAKHFFDGLHILIPNASRAYADRRGGQVLLKRNTSGRKIIRMCGRVLRLFCSLLRLNPL